MTLRSKGRYDYSNMESKASRGENREFDMKKGIFFKKKFLVSEYQ
jgi:hypothetical protein